VSPLRASLIASALMFLCRRRAAAQQARWRRFAPSGCPQGSAAAFRELSRILVLAVPLGVCALLGVGAIGGVIVSINGASR
jgi:hypothetical protein